MTSYDKIPTASEAYTDSNAINLNNISYSYIYDNYIKESINTGLHYCTAPISYYDAQAIKDFFTSKGYKVEICNPRLTISWDNN